MHLAATLDAEAAYRDADYVVIAAPPNVNGKPHRQIYLFEARGIGVI
ncbi:MAG: hypothetical protein V8Q40_06910 [Anaerosacchariphilus sp.]